MSYSVKIQDINLTTSNRNHLETIFLSSRQLISTSIRYYIYTTADCRNETQRTKENIMLRFTSLLINYTPRVTVFTQPTINYKRVVT